MFEKFVEVPNTNIQEPVLASQFADISTPSTHNPL